MTNCLAAVLISWIPQKCNPQQHFRPSRRPADTVFPFGPDRAYNAYPEQSCGPVCYRTSRRTRMCAPQHRYRGWLQCLGAIVFVWPEKGPSHRLLRCFPATGQGWATKKTMFRFYTLPRARRPRPGVWCKQKPALHGRLRIVLAECC